MGGRRFGSSGTNKGHPLEGRKGSWVFSLPPGPEESGRRVQGPSTERRLGFLLICNLKMHSKGSVFIVGTLIRQSAGRGSQGPHGGGHRRRHGDAVSASLGGNLLGENPRTGTCWLRRRVQSG